MHCLIPFGPWSSLHTDSNDFHFLCRLHWSTMQTLHTPDAPVLPRLTRQQSVAERVLTPNPGLPHSSLIYHFNPIFLLPNYPAGKVINFTRPVVRCQIFISFSCCLFMPLIRRDTSTGHGDMHRWWLAWQEDLEDHSAKFKHVVACWMKPECTVLSEWWDSSQNLSFFFFWVQNLRIQRNIKTLWSLNS